MMKPLPPGWTRTSIKSYDRIDNADGRAMAEVYRSGRILIHPDAVGPLGLTVDAWGTDSATSRQTWGVVYP